MTIRNKTKSRRMYLAAMILGGSVLMASAAKSSPIPVGAASVVTPGADTFAGLSLIANESFTTTAYDTSGNAHYTAEVESEVYKDSTTGDLDFAYQVTNVTTPSEPDSLHTVSLFSFSGFTTDVDYVTGSGQVTYANVSRASLLGGFSLSFNYAASNGDGIAPGEATDWIIVKTNATVYNNLGETTMIDGATGSVTSFEPVVPEPMTLSLLAVGAAGVLVKRPKRASVI